jgi:hypothetical protein
MFLNSPRQRQAARAAGREFSDEAARRQPVSPAPEPVSEATQVRQSHGSRKRLHLR